MLSTRVFDQINARLNQIMGTPDGYLGNLAVCLVGDFAQLPPVCGLAIFDSRFHGVGIFQKLFRPILLTISQRQRNDEEFALLLNRARLGALTPEDVIALNSRCLQSFRRKTLLQELADEFSEATHLFPL